MVSLEQLREGSIVMVRGSFGNDPAVRGVVGGVSEDIKNGVAGIDYTVGDADSDDWRWAYLDQVTRVVQY